MFSGICMILDHLANILLFAMEIGYSVVEFTVYGEILPTVISYLSQELSIKLIVLVDGTFFFY